MNRNLDLWQTNQRANKTRGILSQYFRVGKRISVLDDLHEDFNAAMTDKEISELTRLKRLMLRWLKYLERNTITIYYQRVKGYIRIPIEYANLLIILILSGGYLPKIELVNTDISVPAPPERVTDIAIINC